jgi:hypothetical protein
MVRLNPQNITDNRLRPSINVNEKIIWVTGASSCIGKPVMVRNMKAIQRYQPDFSVGWANRMSCYKDTTMEE